MNKQPLRSSNAVAVMGEANMTAPVVSPEIEAALTKQPPAVREYVDRILQQKQLERAR